MQPLSNRTNTFTDSVIRRMTRISAQYNAVNLSQGFPDFDPPKELMDRLSQVAYEDFHQYSITWGAQGFREALAAKQTRFMGHSVDPNREIVVTCGSTEAMMAAMMTVTNPGDKVVIFSPFYENYGADTILSGAEPVYVPLHPPEFNFDPAELEQAFQQHPKALILCNPSNPCGKVFTKEELLFIADLAQKYDTYVITDEVYEHIVYAPHKHVYFASLPGMWERTISCSSLSKTYSITGWRLGYTIAPEAITERIKKVHDFLTVGAAAPLQEAVIPGLNFGQDYYDKLQATYTHKRDLFLKGLKDVGLEFSEPQGAYYVLMDITPFGYDNDLEFCQVLAKEVGVGAVPGSSFFREPLNHLIRFHFAKKDETLNEALNRLEAIHKKIPKRK
ncbi:pyridoxal phosphate-dependent aminotransferase [Evtepia sp.]|uniref:pyridoxal phosphate-dependent aminotransferase n=1 Tax=Evtepia sp. TaxID=2773933 RepID=UPI002E76A61E|nr:aminotransferase class I/II-fold pyridoxal phosphate-dependent enzyme [Evtepia sp.]MEE0256785.1 aminotransferase class I/II-fold pyridoxal phosphate-dependent enzyme [Evtepia sp.]